MKKTKFIAAALAVLFVFNTYAIPRSNAVVIDATAAFGAAAATAAINGTTATTLFTGMGTSAATTAMTTLMGEYAASTGVAASGSAFAASIGASAVVTAAGALVIGAVAGYALLQFINWLRDEKGLEAGGDVVSLSVGNAYLADGTLINIPLDASDANFTEYTYFEYNKQYTTSTGKTFSLTRDLSSRGRNEFVVDGVVTGNSTTSKKVIYYFVSPNRSDATSSSSLNVYGYYRDFSDAGVGFSTGLTVSDLFGDFTSVAMSMEPKASLQELPQELPEGQVLNIDTGLETLPVDDPQAAADAIMQSAIDGVLAPTVSVESDPTVTPDPDPDPEPVPPPDDLPQNLPELGDVLISRFPFSIPWDIGRVLDFLSAEPVAPHIDFQPFKGDLFGIPAGSVSVDYDFSKHEDIAAFCRTFEIVGFCLLLAVGTKRLIWTA